MGTGESGQENRGCFSSSGLQGITVEKSSLFDSLPKLNGCWCL